MVGGNDACSLRMQEPLLELLDDRRLGGVHGVRRLLGSERRVSIVATDDMGMAEEAITHHCQCWGGFGDLLVPMTSAATSLAEPWAILVRRLDVELIETNGTIEQDELERNGVLVMEGSGIHDPLLVALLANGVKRDDARTVQVPRLSDTLRAETRAPVRLDVAVLRRTGLVAGFGPGRLLLELGEDEASVAAAFVQKGPRTPGLVIGEEHWR